jgi:spore maturation protein CgeB
MNIVILGLSITSAWGNGHATTYRSLIRGLNKNGHKVTFLERDVPWYADQRDFTTSDYCTIHLYSDLDDLKKNHHQTVRNADLVMVGSFVPEGVKVGQWVLETAGGIKAFYDIDTPVTLAKLQRGDYEYLHPSLIPAYDIYLSFAGGKVLDVFAEEYGSTCTRPLYCSVDTDLYFPEQLEHKWDLGYLGTYSDDRQPPLKTLLMDAARLWKKGRFIVAGPQYPDTIQWPVNVDRVDHLPPALHRKFYNEQRFTLNITRKDMIRMGHSPSVRLFEAAACAIPVISDYWDGLNDFFNFGTEILVSYSPHKTIDFLKNISEEERREIGQNARKRVLEAHTGQKRALELEKYALDLKAIYY